MIELIPDVFITQILYRKDGEEFVLGYIGEYEGKGVAKRYKNTDHNYMYKDFVHSYRCSVDGVKWTIPWDTYSGAIRRLLKKHGKDTLRGSSHIIPTPQTFKGTWK